MVGVRWRLAQRVIRVMRSARRVVGAMVGSASVLRWVVLVLLLRNRPLNVSVVKIGAWIGWTDHAVNI
ncbi:hypothetical protein A5742_21315 [Mycolicibacterium fortuitum]|uniref:Uncharacterized protein n=1 Tax=Mycolicibacterium fortuitum TaxID=1766 RepID=A0ABD6QRE9_MYCFO|nr:hypothetical protein A5742_21315 [Mycolicibacterium fortuitum]